jgi:hypothetical protein
VFTRIGLVALSGLAVLATAPPTAAAPTADASAGGRSTPAVRVTPASGLEAGDRVRVRARGLPADTPVTLLLCHVAPVGDWTNCYPDLGTATTDAAGRLAVGVRLRDPVYYQPVDAPWPEGPVYCRADQCRLFVTWRDESGQPGSVGSDALNFRGSPATLAVTPPYGHTDGQVVRVTGTAYGSDARRVEIWQHWCYSHVGERVCEGHLAAAVPLRRNGTFTADVAVRRYVDTAEGPVDCADDSWGWCQFTAFVLDPGTGLPDPTFGDPAYFHPAAPIHIAVE